MRALAPWLAALETDSDQGESPAKGSEDRVRAAEEQIEFERLFNQHGAALLDYLYGLTCNHEAATDLTQETFLRAWASATPLVEVRQPKAWLYRIATNLALNQRRRQRRFVWLPLETVEPLSAAGSSNRWRVPPLASDLRGADDMAASVVERDAIWETLAALPPRQQAASGGDVTPLPDTYRVVAWRNDGAAAVLAGQGATEHYTLATKQLSPLPGDAYNYDWGA
jgi:RNA polymerase sigma factor (sigma-70 family)